MGALLKGTHPCLSYFRYQPSIPRVRLSLMQLSFPEATSSLLLLTRLVAAGVLCLAVGPLTAGVAVVDDQWHYSFTPYIWLPNISQRLEYDQPLGRATSPSVEVEVEPDNYLSDLKFGLTGMLEARKGQWSLGMDLIYTDFGSQDAKVHGIALPGGTALPNLHSQAQVDIEALVWEGIGGYTLARHSIGTLDVFGGVRYLGLKTSTDLSLTGAEGLFNPTRGSSDQLDVWDGIIGIRGEVTPGTEGNWFLPYYLDIGAGNYSNWTWQAWGGLGYRFDWGDLVLVYRNLSYSTSGHELLQDLRMGGPALGATFRW